MKLANKSNVALVTSDTYRIAAVEQLKIYANILGIPLNVDFVVALSTRNISLSFSGIVFNNCTRSSFLEEMADGPGRTVKKFS